MPSAIAGLTRMRAFIVRQDGLARLGLREGRNLWVVRFLGVLHLVGSVAVIAGLPRPRTGMAGAALEAAVFGWVLSRQLRAGDRGGRLTAYLIFTGMALAVLLVNAIR